MMEPYIGSVAMVAFDWAPRGWVPCDGRILPIATYQALFALLGATFGGDGKTTFGVPDLRGRVAVGPGPYMRGEWGGAVSVNLQPAHTAHTHTMMAAASGGRTATKDPAGAVPAGGSGQSIYAAAPDKPAMSGGMIAPQGSGQAHTNMQPFLGINFIMAYEGVFPPRP